MTDRSHYAGTIWAAKRLDVRPNGYVRCDGDDLLFTIEPGDGHAYTVRLPRRLARLMAKRINQCLDETK